MTANTTTSSSAGSGTTGSDQTLDNSALDTSSQTYMSEYTVNTTMNNTGGPNSLLQDVALSSEQMESALTVGTESLHD